MLPDKLRKSVMERDGWRCRWCSLGPGDNLDIHHVRYRRGDSDDVMENLISLCRDHHGFVHGAKPNNKRELIVKSVAQQVLYFVMDNPGVNGREHWRHLRVQWAHEGRCDKHGLIPMDECLECA